MKRKKYDEMKELKHLIKRKNISYRELAKDMGMSTDAVNNKLNGYTAFNLYEAEKLIEFLNIEAKDINRYFFSKCCETQQKLKNNYFYA